MKKKAWMIAGELFRNARPVIRGEEEQTWEDNIDVSEFYDQNLSLDWGSNVPGSGAPEKIMVAAVQAVENRGYRVSDEGYEYLEKGLEAFDAGDFDALHRYSALLRRELANAKKDEEADYWKFHYYDDFSAYEKAVSFPVPGKINPKEASFREKVRAAWLGQLIGGAMGTMVEGYSHRMLSETFGDVRDYLRTPNTYNDDVTYELAFLDALQKKGKAVTAEDIALSWVGLIPCGWSAEEAAIRNIKNGIFPPESGRRNNPFNEWIGAQMRGGICGMAAPGNPRLAARLAWMDGSVSHANNGILGEIFTAVLTSLAFVEKEARRILQTAIGMIPKDSEYRSVIDFAFMCCEKCGNWQEALSLCEERYEKYNWIHAYPNACCLVIALFYGKGDFAETLHIITMCGLDADCNAGVAMTVIAAAGGLSSIPDRYMHEAFGKLTTYMRGRYRELSMDELADLTVKAAAAVYDTLE